MNPSMEQSLSDLVLERVGFGVFVLDRSMKVLMWNRFMQDHSRLSAENVVGKSIFVNFPELPRVWLARKVESVFQLGSFAFSSWEQRPYLFKFDHDRPITISDVTHVSVMQREREEAVVKLQEYANRDGLTGIANRRYFESRLSDEFIRWQRYGGELSVLLFDLDHFKEINDRFGHAVGDTVLRVMAQRVGSAVRAQDIFGRFGGEEFALLLPCTPLADALVVAEKIRTTIEQMPVEADGVRVSVTASIGGAAARLGLPSCEVLINEADAALYSAKRQGRNRCIALA
jgi:diguanylate cyclase (GGDEF)-like protein